MAQVQIRVRQFNKFRANNTSPLAKIELMRLNIKIGNRLKKYDKHTVFMFIQTYMLCIVCQYLYIVNS